MICEVERVMDFPLPDTSAGRSQGVHVSSIIRCIATEVGILKPEIAEELDLVDVRDMSKIGIVAQLRIHMGLVWEEHYLPLIPDVVKHPGESCVDGVYMTPDGESLSVVVSNRNLWGVKVHEVKCTYKSTRTTGADGPKPLDGKSNLMWMCQLKSYCKAKDTLYADLHVLHTCGDYSYPISPELIIYHCQFTKEEIEDNWTFLQDYKQYKLKEAEERTLNL
jgi:hypothetical protein